MIPVRMHLDERRAVQLADLRVGGRADKILAALDPVPA